MAVLFRIRFWFWISAILGAVVAILWIVSLARPVEINLTHVVISATDGRTIVGVSRMPIAVKGRLLALGNSGMSALLLPFRFWIPNYNRIGAGDWSTNPPLSDVHVLNFSLEPLVMLMALISVMLLWLERRRPPSGHCQVCGYDLTGNTSGMCPECGTVVFRSESGATQGVPLT